MTGVALRSLVMLALWVVPGGVLVWRGSGLTPRAFAWWPLSVVASLVLVPVAALLGSMLHSPMTPAASALSIVVVTGIASLAMRPVRHALDRFVWPTPILGALIAAYVVVRLAVGLKLPDSRLSLPDGPYFVGMIRGLADGFPPRNYDAYPEVLKQPWAYWLFYATGHVVSGLSIDVIQGVCSALAAGALLLALHLFVQAVTDGKRRAADLAVLLALGACDGRWVVSSLVEGRLVRAFPGTTFGFSFPASLWAASYNGPALIVGVMILFLTLETRKTDARGLFVAKWVLASFLPWLHVVYATVFVGVAMVTHAVDAARRRGQRRALFLILTPVPFTLLFVYLFAGGHHAAVPYVPAWTFHDHVLDFVTARAVWLVSWAGLYLPASIVGAFLACKRGPRGVPLAVLLIIPASVMLFFANRANNYHWEHDPLAIGLAAAAGIGLDALVAWRGVAGVASGAILTVLAAVGARYDVLARTIVADSRRVTDPDQLALADWIKTNTEPRARFLIAPNAFHSYSTVVGLGERPVHFGFAFHLLTVDDEDTVRRRKSDNSAMIEDPCSPILRARGIDYVVLENAARIASGWRSRVQPVYASPTFSVYDARSPSCGERAPK